MRVIGIPVLVTSLALVAAVVLASPGDTPSPPPGQPPSSQSIPATGTAPATGLRAEAELSYALAYEEIAKARKDMEAGKEKNAQKRFKRALGRVEGAVALDPRYHEAWNLLGYSARRLGDYDKAFMAYEKCLDIKPDYAPAREYLGEARLEKGDVAQARQQLVMLERFNPESEEAKALRGAIDTYLAAHPEGVKAEAIPAVPETLRTAEKK